MTSRAAFSRRVVGAADLSDLQSLGVLVCQLILSGAFLLAGVGKMLQSAAFSDALRSSQLPERAIRPLVVSVPVTELALAIGLIFATPVTLFLSLTIAILVLAAFTAWLAWVRLRGLQVQCGCFGSRGSEIGPRTFARNTLLILAALTGLVLATRANSPLPTPSLFWGSTVISAAMAFALLLALRRGVGALVLSVSALSSGGASTGPIHGESSSNQGR